MSNQRPSDRDSRPPIALVLDVLTAIALAGVVMILCALIYLSQGKP
jgi:hypothetical protein